MTRPDPDLSYEGNVPAVVAAVPELRDQLAAHTFVATRPPGLPQEATVYGDRDRPTADPAG